MGGSRTSLRSRALETGRKYSTQEEIVMGVDRHLDLIGTKVLDGVNHSGIAVEVRYHELL